MAFSSTSVIGGLIFIFCLPVKDIRSEAIAEIKLQLTNSVLTTQFLGFMSQPQIFLFINIFP